MLSDLAAARDKTDEIFTETKQLEARVRKETADLARMRKAEAEASVLTADMLAAVPEAGKARVGRNTLDLEAITFAAGGHLMANRKCHLPPGSFRVAKKGYEEVHVPALKAKPFTDGEALVRIDDMPAWARPAFGGMSSLNRVQSRVYDCALFSAENMLLCAPTGAGKTNVAMLCILQCIKQHIEAGIIKRDKFKIVYVAPMKALAAEMTAGFGKRLEPLGITVRELTGDMSLTKTEIANTQVYCHVKIGFDEQCTATAVKIRDQINKPATLLIDFILYL